MRWGFPWSTYWGDHESVYRVFRWKGNGTGRGAVVELQAADGYGDDWHAIISDERRVRIVYLKAGDPVKTFNVPFGEVNRTKHTISVEPLGQWDYDAGIDVTFPQVEFLADKGKSVRIEWNTVIVGFASTTSQLDNWSLTGLRRFYTCRPFGRAADQQVDITLTNSGTTRTLTLSLNGVVLATGSRSGDGAITLEAQNNSGVSGSVDVTYTADIEEGDAYVLAAWATHYEVTLDAPTPRTVTVPDSGTERMSVVLDNVTAGTYDYTITAIRDGADCGTTAADSVTVFGRPEPPTNLAYVSGNYANTVLAWNPSATPGATYRVYRSDFDGSIDFTTPVATVGASASAIFSTMPTMGTAGTGVVQYCIEAVSGGIESGTKVQISVEYVAGSYAAHPNNPAFAVKEMDAVDGPIVSYSYNTIGEGDFPVELELYLSTDPNSPGAPVATAILSSAQRQGSVYTGQIQATGVSGLLYYLVRARGSFARSPNTTMKGPVYCVADNTKAPTGASAVVVA